MGSTEWGYHQSFGRYKAEGEDSEDLCMDFEGCDGKKCDKWIATVSVLLAICVLLQIVLVISTYKFFRALKIKKKLLTISSVFLNLTVFTRILYYTHEIFSKRRNCNAVPHQCLNGITTNFSIYCLLVSFSFGILNWLNQIREIKKYTQTTKNHLSNCLKLTIILIILIFISLFTLTALFSCYSPQGINNSTIDTSTQFVIIICFFLIGVIYPTAGYYFYKQLKVFCMQKALEMKRQILLPTNLVVVSVLIRATYNTFSYRFKLEKYFEQKGICCNNTKFPILIGLYFVVTDFLPIISQIILMSILSKNLKLSTEASPHSEADTLTRSLVQENDTFTDSSILMNDSHPSSELYFEGDRSDFYTDESLRRQEGIP
ncbi:unnamed protein product [Moneuplotes crassus]|uniref:Uncharacterized protein n=1 Tax=Euplotes crassus TaxID=5936 RepID=A0AAD1UU01_EUPCR|nr:unnamed protein product [Moneuplotes crassus]